MAPVFEMRDADAAGRIGELSVPRSGATVETPALLPVVNPHLQGIEPARLASEFGAQILITNAYVLHGSDDLREAVEARGLHDLLGFDGAIMTDSGSFQLAEYGEITVTTEEILRFQHAIGSDVATPVDIPTPPDVDRERAEAELATTQERLELAASLDLGDMLLSAPVQGSTYPELRERAARDAYATGLDVYPVGAMVPLMTDYRFADVVDAVAAAKRGLGADAPVHLFGAGHPMMFALAAALGCDLFDSAAYVLYARDDRYLTESGTEHLADLDYFPCACPVCSSHDPAGLRELPDDEREDALAAHNLHVSFAEVRRIRQAIRDGDLLELVEERARAHPAMLDGYRALLGHADQLERDDPARKGTFFYLSAESAARPEVRRHHDRLSRLSPPDRVLLSAVPGVDAGSLAGDESLPDALCDVDETWRVKPPFGPYPPALAETYPLTAEVPERVDESALAAAVEGIVRLVEANPDVSLILAHDGWPAHVVERLPDGVSLVDVADVG